MCMGPTHRIAGAYAGALHGRMSGLPWWACAGTALAATLTAAGPLSPDADQRKGWRRMDRWLPDEMFGWGGPLKHRGIMHWPGLPLAAVWAVHGAHDATPPQSGVLGLVLTAWWALAWALIVGWSSHLLLDTVWGRAFGSRGRGVPWLGWTGYVGVGLDAGGVTEHVVRWAMVIWPLLYVAGMVATT